MCPLREPLALAARRGFGRILVTAISTTGAISGAGPEQARTCWKMHRHSQTEARFRSATMTKMKIDTGDILRRIRAIAILQSWWNLAEEFELYQATHR